MKDKNNALPIGVGLGLLIGTIIGYLSNNLELWIPIGTSVGMLLGSTWDSQSKYRRMIMENSIDQIVNDIAISINNIIPVKWKDAYFYGEVGENITNFFLDFTG